MSQPLVNIMMPVYNGMPMLKASIESIKRQTYKNWLCILCDDGSTDDTWDYLQTIVQYDSRFIIIRNEENLGRGASRQHILQHCIGTYICMLDSGDLMHPDRIAHQVTYLQRHPNVGFVSSGMLSFGTHTPMLRVRGLDSMKNNKPCFAPSMYHTDIAKEAEYNPNMREGEDRDFMNRYFNLNKSVHVLPEVLYYYSEFDSATLCSARSSYRTNIISAIRMRNMTMVIQYIFKYIYSLFVFPFINWDAQVAKRGFSPTPQQIQEFYKYGKSLL